MSGPLVGPEEERSLPLRLPQRRQATVHELELGRVERILRRHEPGRDREREEQDGHEGRRSS